MTSATIDEQPGSLDALLELAARDKAGGLGDAPWPPNFAKQPDEPRRVLDQILTPALTPAEQARINIIMTGSSHDSSTFTQIGTQTNYNRP